MTGPSSDDTDRRKHVVLNLTRGEAQELRQELFNVSARLADKPDPRGAERIRRVNDKLGRSMNPGRER